jgi:hypothetical protein
MPIQGSNKPKLLILIKQALHRLLILLLKSSKALCHRLHQSKEPHVFYLLLSWLALYLPLFSKQKKSLSVFVKISQGMPRKKERKLFAFFFFE